MQPSVLTYCKVATTILESGVELSTQDRTALEVVGDYIEDQLAANNGVTGFCEFIEGLSRQHR